MAISPVKKNVFLALLGVIAAAILLAFVYRDTLVALVVSSVSDADENHIEQFVGQSPSAELLVSKRDDGEAVPIARLLNEKAILVTYRESCSACRSAVNHYLAIRGGREDYGETVYLLADNESNIPNGFPARRFLRIEDAPDEHMFEGRASPRIYRFDESGTLTDFMVGHRDVDFQQWMTQIYGS